MGFFSGIRRRIKKLIPKEIRPAIPFIAAAMIPGAGIAGLGPIQSKFLTAAAARGLSDDEANLKDALRAGALAAAPAALDRGIAGLDSSKGLGKFLTTAGKGKDATSIAEKVSRFANPSGMDALKVVGTQAATDFGIKQAELNQKAIEEYERDLLQRGIRDKAARRTAIFVIFVGAGDDADETNAMLDKYGYKDGGEVMKASMSLREILELADKTNKAEKKKRKRISRKEGGGTDFIFGAELLKKRNPETGELFTIDEVEEYLEKAKGFDSGEFTSNLESGVAGLEAAFGQPLGGRRPEPMRIIPGFAEGGDVDEVMEFDEEIITPDYLMKEEGVEIGEQVSSPNVMDELNQLSLDLFGRPVFELTEDEFEALKDLASQQALKPGLIDEYRNYKYQMEEQGITPMSPRDYFRNEFGAARLGVAKGGPIDIKKPNMEKDTKGKTAGPDYYIKRVEDLMDLGYDYEEAGRIAMDYDEYRSAMDKGEVDDYKEGGVIKKKTIKIIGVGKAKDYPGIKKLIEMNKKGKKRFSKAEGGLMNLGGKELDLRGGGFVPMGKKEKADDVPARLSKNEFVFTADAVRAAGGGSVQKGADLMYDTMKKLEAQS